VRSHARHARVVALVASATFARQHFPGEDPIERTLITGMAELPAPVVGVVADVRSTDLKTPPDADYAADGRHRPLLDRTGRGGPACRS
jgi:hypothetical protein